MKKSHIALLVFVVIALGAIFSMVYKADTYSSFAHAREHPGRQFHIIGELEPGKPITEEISGNNLYLSFYLRDSEGGLARVVYPGARPVDFEKSDQVVLIGAFQDKEDVFFMASSLLMKCPSKYNPDETQLSLGDQ